MISKGLSGRDEPDSSVEYLAVSSCNRIPHKSLLPIVSSSQNNRFQSDL